MQAPHGAMSRPCTPLRRGASFRSLRGVSVTAPYLHEWSVMNTPNRTLLLMWLAFAACQANSPSGEILPGPCPPGPSAIQSPALFSGPGAIDVDDAASCDPEGSAWAPCHEHLHCPIEHSGGPVCVDAACEMHSVYRQRIDGSIATKVENLHEGTVGGNCDPEDHHLMVRARFIAFGDGNPGEAHDVTYCGSATGNAALDTDFDGVVTCLESGVNAVSVRWCLETACLRDVADQHEAELLFGEDEPSRVQGCTGPT